MIKATDSLNTTASSVWQFTVNQKEEDWKDSTGSGGTSAWVSVSGDGRFTLVGAGGGDDKVMLFDYDEEDEEELQIEPESESLVIQEPALATQATHVNSHEWLPEGGTYDSTTGTTWYMLPDGNKWWMQEDGSFVLYQSVEVITPENHVVSEENGMQ